MKKFLLITALLVPAVASAADAAVLEQPAPSTTPEYVTIAHTDTPGVFTMTWTDPVRSPLGVSMQFTQEQVENGMVQIGYTLNGVFQKDQWYRADFSDVVVFFKEGTQKLYRLTPEQKEMIIEAELSVDEKAEVLQAAHEVQFKTLRDLVKKAKEVITEKIETQDAVADEDAQEQQVDAPAYAERSGSEDAEVVAQDEAAVEEAVADDAEQAAVEQTDDSDADDSDEQQADQADVPVQDSVDARDVFASGFTD